MLAEDVLHGAHAFSCAYHVTRSCEHAGGNPYATPEVSHHGAQELALNPKLAPAPANGHAAHMNGKSAAP